eukprot:12403743-Karenia_brevis.AAC.1
MGAQSLLGPLGPQRARRARRALWAHPRPWALGPKPDQHGSAVYELNRNSESISTESISMEEINKGRRQHPAG